jgi:integrase
MAGKARENGEGSIYPYRKGFAAYAWVTLPSGKRQRKYVYGKTRDEVHGKWIKLLNDAKAGPVTTKIPKVGPYLLNWLEEVIKPNSAPLTYATYETFVRLHIVPHLGEKPLNFTVQVGQQWMNALAKRCQCCAQGKDARRAEDKRRCCAVGKCCKGFLSLRTLTDVRACLRSSLTHAMVEELLTRNVMKLVKVPSNSQRGRKRKVRRWSTAETKTFLVSARQDDDPFYAAYVLVIAMAMRKGEVLGLPEDAADESTGKLDIGHQLQRVRSELLHRATKTEASDDDLPMPPIATTAVRLRRLQRVADRKHADISWQESGLLFTTRHGTPIEPRNFNRSWDRRCEKAGVPKITVHDGRRSCASLLAELGVHPRVIMRILRHANMKVTMEIYTEVSDEATRKALQQLSESLDI